MQVERSDIWKISVGSIELSGGRVRNAWVTCPVQGDNTEKSVRKPPKLTGPHGLVRKTPVVQDGPASD